MPLESIILLVLQLALVGVVLYLIERFIPMDAAVKILIRVVVVVAAVLWLLQRF